MLNQTLIGLYARNVIIFGNRTLDSVHPTYIEAVKIFIVKTYTVNQIQNAKNKGWITEGEEAELMLLREEQLASGMNVAEESSKVI